MGHKVTIVDNLSKGPLDAEFTSWVSDNPVSFIQADLADPAQLQGIHRDFDYVFHAAAMNGTANFYTRSFEVVENSTLPTVHLLRHLGADFSGRFVYFGSSEAYAGGVTQGWISLPTVEEVPLVIDNVLNPRWSYGASKLHGEVTTVAAGASFGITWTIVRVHNSYGPRMGDQHVIPDFILRAFRKDYRLFGHAESRCFAYVEDIVSAILMAAESENTRNKIVNVGSDEEISILALGNMILEVMGLSGTIELHPSPEGSVMRRAPDLSLVRGLGWAPSVPIRDGLRKTVEWYENNKSS